MAFPAPQVVRVPVRRVLTTPSLDLLSSFEFEFDAKVAPGAGGAGRSRRKEKGEFGPMGRVVRSSDSGKTAPDRRERESEELD